MPTPADKKKKINLWKINSLNRKTLMPVINSHFLLMLLETDLNTGETVCVCTCVYVGIKEKN